MSKSIRLLTFTLLMGVTLGAFQNCSGSGQNLPSATEMASFSQDGFGGGGGGGASGGGGGQVLCTARGEWRDDNGAMHVVSMTGGGPYNSAYSDALKNCNSMMSFEMSTSNVTHGGGTTTSDCEVVSCD